MYMFKKITNYISPRQPKSDKTLSLRPHHDSLTAKYININKGI